MFIKNITRRSFLTLSAMTAVVLAFDWKKIHAWTTSMGPGKIYPTVIIGAGLGGLCCGAYLARQGIPVTIVEKNDIPGGYASAFERKKGKFTFECSLHGLSAKNNAVQRILEDLGIHSQIAFAELPEVYSLNTPNFEICMPQQDPETYIKRLGRLFPHEADGIRGFVETMIAIADDEDRLHQNNGKFLKLLFPVQYPNMWRVRNMTLEEMLNEHVHTPALQDVLAGLWGYFGLPQSQLSAFYYSVATGNYLKRGDYYIKPNSQALSHALANVILSGGGKILYGKKAQRILVKNNAATGVEIEDGTVLPAQAVVSNCSAVTTFEKLLEPKVLPDEYLAKIRGYRPSLSAFIVWLGLSEDIRSQVANYSTHLASDLGNEADYLASVNGDINNGPFSVVVYDKVGNGNSPADSSTLMLMFCCGFDVWKKYEEEYHSGNKAAYYREKERWTQTLIRRTEERLLPGLSSIIEVKESATPLTIMRFTGNTAGAIYGFEQSRKNAFIHRISNRTPVKGLYLASAWGNPGGGFEGALRSGEATFRMLINSWGA